MSERKLVWNSLWPKWVFKIVAVAFVICCVAVWFFAFAVPEHDSKNQLSRVCSVISVEQKGREGRNAYSIEIGTKECSVLRIEARDLQGENVAALAATLIPGERYSFALGESSASISAAFFGLPAIAVYGFEKTG